MPSHQQRVNSARPPSFAQRASDRKVLEWRLLIAVVWISSTTVEVEHLGGLGEVASADLPPSLEIGPSAMKGSARLRRAMPSTISRAGRSR